MFIDPFQEKIWKDKYQYEDETYEEFCHRISDNIFSTEKEDKEKLFNLLIDFKVMFGGRINSNIGVSEQGLTLFNCFIEATSKNPDSLEGIMDMATKYAMTLKTEGGVGFCANFLRPAKTLIKKIGVTSPGSIKFLEIFDKVSEVITSGSVDKGDSYQGIPSKNSIRKGATMVTLNINHPDIEEFITAKSVPNRLTKMNMSVLITDAFMYAVNNDLDWDLWFPDINFDKYDDEWDGNFEAWAEKGYPYVVYKKIRAQELWELLLKNSYARNEPGILFIDNVRKMDNLHYLDGGAITATNPCFTGDMLLHTSEGMERIKDLYTKGTDNAVYVDNRVVNNSLGTSLLPASYVYKTGYKDVYKITTVAGREIKATEYHKFHTDKDDKQLKDLNVGDKLSVCSGECGFGKNGDMDFGKLLGLVVGDGTIYKGWSKKDNCSDNRIFIRLWGKDNSLSDEVVEIANNLILKCGGRYSTTTVSKRYIKSRDMFEIKSSVLYRIFDEFGLLEAKKGVPDYVFKGNKEFIVGYLRGLFQADGTVAVSDKARCSIRLNSSEPSLLKDIQILLSNFGILSNINLRRKSSYRKLPDGNGGMKKYLCKDNYELMIFSSSRDIFMKEIGFMLPYKNDKFFNWRKLHEPYRQQFYDTIKTIEFAGKEDVYCLTQKDYNSIICNGFSTSQCGEVPGNTGIIKYNGEMIQLGDVCNLGSINLTKFYDIKENRFCVKELKDAVDIMVRSLDNIIEISNYPLDMYEQASKLKRKIGIGLMGVGSLMMMMDLRYGSEECLDVLGAILKEFMNQAYESSAMIASEKGPFPLWDAKALDGGFLNSGILKPSVLNLVEKHGLRNSAVSAIAPNGTLSIVAGNISGGLEPVFAKEFTRWNRVEGKQVNFEYPNVHKGEWFETSYFKEQQIADEAILVSKDGEYRIDKNIGLCKKTTIKDYGYKLAVENGNTELTGAQDLTVEEHLNVLRIFAKYIDQSCSKTINLPAELSFEDFKSLYGKIHSYGIKGCTTYREGTSVAVLETQKKEQEKSVKQQQKEFLEMFKGQENGDIIFENVELPDEYPAKGYILKSENKKWYLSVAFKDKACTRPFAIFVNTNNKEDNVVTFNTLDVLESIALSKGLRSEFIEETKKKCSYQKNPVKVCRMLGLLLRHNVSIYTIVKGLDTIEEAIPGTFIHRMKKFLGQFITKISDPTMCPECGEKAIIFESGCHICKNCGHSKC
jgi:ribonucleoside-diphosphate reductase alpha chain